MSPDLSADPPANLSADLPEAVLHERNRSFAIEDSAAPSRWMRWAAFVLIALFGLLLRLPQLDARPMHTDEAVNAYIVGELLAGETFSYDPQDRHGPMLAALALPLARVQGAKLFADLTESELRLTAVLAGTVTILLFCAAVEMFGFVPCLIAALLFACAPLPIYYDRYFIHESLFAAATFGLILAGWRARKKPSPVQAALAATCAALMLACKETAVLNIFALAAAAFAFWLWNLRGKSPGGLWRPKEMLAAAAVFLLVTVMLFTWFGSNWKALPALLHAVPNFLARAGGEGHQKPFWYFAQLLTGGWSGGLISALACLGFFQTARKRDPSPYGFLAWYALFLAVIYSLIPYKTPWLALNLWLPIALFAGLAINSLWRMPTKSPALRIPMPAFCILLGAVAAVLIAHDTRQRVFAHPADETNPYAYAHTSEDLLGLPAEVVELAHQDGLASPRIAVIASDPWPLPWYLRHFSNVGFWQPGQQVGQADFYITSTEAADQYGDQLHDLRSEFFGVRPGVLILLWSPAPK
jgi:uncharacterized protein (TIGR03663 family)